MDAPGPADEVSVEVAAALLGITPRRYRQLASEGYCTIHTRGRTTVSSAVSGFVRSLRAQADTSPTAAAAARGHAAKAALIRSHTSRRRAALTLRAEAEEVVKTIADTATRRLKDACFPNSLPPLAGTTFRAEIIAACARIEAARDLALAALATGDLGLLDGGANG